MKLVKSLMLLILASLFGWSGMAAAGDANSGLLIDDFPLTLETGVGTEAAGPFWGYYETDEVKIWRFSPFFSKLEYPGAETKEFDLLYPILTLDRFGEEYRFQIAQWFAFSGGSRVDGDGVEKFTLFPIYFQQRSENPEENYTALVPIYGTLKNRFFRDEVKFIMMPLWARSKKKDIVTDNYLFPFFHLRTGDGLRGWQFLPLVGMEKKEITYKTNMWEEQEMVPGHKSFFALWPLFFEEKLGIGSENPVRKHLFLPFYALERSPQRDSSSYLWPLGLTITDDRGKGYKEVGFPWPLIVFAHGSKETWRVWPIYSHAENADLESSFVLWPVYKYNRVKTEPLGRERWRILFFLYSDTTEANTDTGTEYKRRDFWPFFTQQKQHDGSSRLQILAPLEPLLPASDSIERNYSPLWSLWRQENDPEAGRKSESLLWNLYRMDKAPEEKKCSFLFGLFQYKKTPQGRRWKLFFIPLGKDPEASVETPAASE